MTGDLDFDLDGALALIAGVEGARPVEIAAIEIGTGALARLPQLLDRHLELGPGDTVALLVDGVGMDYAGSDLYAAVSALLPAGVRPRTAVVPTVDGRAHADPATVDDAVGQVMGASVLISVGSGTLVDIGKAVSARLDGLFHVVVQSALSVNGYADDQSVLLIDGVKRTTPSRWPDIVIADTDVLANAPAQLNAAGIGDLMAMFTAPADWRLASLLGMGEGYSAPLVNMVREQGARLSRAAGGLPDRDAPAIEYVAKVLTLSGISMGAAGVTAPSSGAEHTISHLIEMASAARGDASAYHGAQVGVSTVLIALVWDRVRALIGRGEMTLRFPAEDELEAEVRGAFEPLDPTGAMGEECWRLYRRKLARWTDLRDQLQRTDWAAVDAAVAPLLTQPAQVIATLRAAGGPVRFADLDPPVDAGTVRWALTHCHLLRDRFSVIDLAFFLGDWGPDARQAILAQAGELGAGL